MTVAQARPLPKDWKDRLGLTYRRAPELYETADMVVDVPHAPAIRAALEEMGLSAVFCVQGVPTVAILATDIYDRAAVVDLHGKLWNQGLASLLLVLAENTLRVYSLARTPIEEPGEAFETRCLIEALDLTVEALRFRNLIDGAESGRLWRDHGDYFQPKERIDQVLLDNLKHSHLLLQAHALSSDAAQALLIQAMFIAYLEDREIVTPAYFEGISKGRTQNFVELLSTGDVELLRALFHTLRADFNGDLFVAPCSFESEAEAPAIGPQHLAILSRFRAGREEMAHGQQRFWGYDFRFIPIELVSAVYDRFLGERETERRAKGAYYTPMFLADTVVAQVWALLPDRTKGSGRFLDPACGSGVFLVRSFQRLCEHWRGTHTNRCIPWKTLLDLLGQMHGWDINGSAVRVAVFSLYVALLEEVSPRDIRALISRGKILPELWGKTLACRDFFSAEPADLRFDVIIGNPPWTSRRGPARSSVAWSKITGHPMPGGEDAWAFSWKALLHVTDHGLVAFLLPAMGFLHNHARNTVVARNLFFTRCRVRRVINFADLRFQLFEKAHRPAALIIYGGGTSKDFPYSLDYWAPKADLNLRIKRVITLSSADKLTLAVAAVLENPLLFKQRLWMREPDAKLFAFLARLPKLGLFIQDYGSLSRRREPVACRWVIGQGYQPFNPSEEGEDADRQDLVEDEVRGPIASTYVGTLPDLPIGAFTRFAQGASGLLPAASPDVRRRGFEAGFGGARILVPRGVETAQRRLRATYCDEPLTFQHIIQAITIPDGEEERAKLLTAYLNSRLAVWYAFHGTASFGSDRPEVAQAELLHLPFPSAADLPGPARAEASAEPLIKIIDDALAELKRPFALAHDRPDLLQTIDRLIYAYFGLSDDEIALVDDTVDYIMPALQPHEGHFPALWGAPDRVERGCYARTLAQSLSDWLRGSDGIGTRLMAHSADLSVLRLKIGGACDYEEEESGELTTVLGRLAEHINQPLDGNFQLTPNLRAFVGDSLYLVKPMQRRFWLRSTALADADAIALDLQQVSATDKCRSTG